MTNEEFDKEQFRVGDEIVFKKYYFREREINFDRRTINGYYPSEIIEIIHKNNNHETRNYI